MDHSQSLPASIAQVQAELNSREFLQAFGDEVGVTTESITTSTQDGRDVAEMDWMFSTEKSGIPALARKFLSSEVVLHWHQSWQFDPDGGQGELLVVLDGRPSARTTGTTTLSRDGANTILKTSTNTKTTLPKLVGGPIETSIDRELVGWIVSVQARVLLRRLGDG